MRELSLDWLSFTYVPESVRLHNFYDKKKGINEYQEGLDILDCFCEDFPELSDVVNNHMVNIGGKMHYNTCLKFNDDFMLLYNDLNNPLVSGAESHLQRMGINFVIPSHSLDLFFKLLGFDRDNIRGLFLLLYSRHCQVSRIDLCYDDYDKKYRPYDYCKLMFDNRLKTHFQSIKYDGSGKKTGNTIYFGSLKKRNKLLRIYDKDIESDGLIDSVRYEFELHADNAKAMADKFMYEVEFDFFDYLRSWFEVLVPHNCETRGNVSVCPEWLDYFSKDRFSEKIIVKPYNDKERVKSLVRFVESQTLPSLKGFIALYGWNYLRNLLDNIDMNDKYLDYINSLDFRGLLFKPCLHSPFEDI